MRTKRILVSYPEHRADFELRLLELSVPNPSKIGVFPLDLIIPEAKDLKASGLMDNIDFLLLFVGLDATLSDQGWFLVGRAVGADVPVLIHSDYVALASQEGWPAFLAQTHTDSQLQKLLTVIRAADYDEPSGENYANLIAWIQAEFGSK